MVRCGVSVAALAAGAFGVAVAERGAWGDIPAYTLVGSFPLVADAWDITADGRVMRINGSVVSLQDGPNAAGYAMVGALAPGLVSSFGASFLRIAPGGSRVAVGDNNVGAGATVYVANLASGLPGPIPTVGIPSPNADAAWADAQTLYVSGFGSESVLTRLDTGTLSATTVVSGVGAGSGGVAVHGGRVYTGIGFDFGSATGDVRSFDLGGLNSAAAATPFATGAFEGNALSASSLGFDGAGNLLVGGGDFFSSSPDFGYAAVLDLVPGGGRLELSPAGAGAFYGVRFNHATNELLVVADGTAYRYAVPGPGGGVLLGAAGVITARRRREIR